MNIDIRTIVLVLAITHLIQVVVFYQQYKANKSYQGVGWWLLWSIAEIIGFAGILLRGIPAMHSMAIIIQNTCIFLGTIFIYIGVMRFLGKEVNSKIIFAVSTFFVIATVYFTYVDDSAFMRKVIFNAALAGTSLLTAYVLFVHKMPSITSSAHFNAAVFLVHGAVFTYRTVTVLSGAHIDDFFRPTLYNYLPVLDALIVSLLWTYGFIIMLNQRLNAEMTESEEELRLAEETYRNIFLNSQIGLFRTDLQTGLILDANDTVACFIGYPDRASLLAKPFSMVERYVDAHVRDEMRYIVQTHGEIHNYEARFRRNDGSIIWMRFSARIVRGKGWMEGVSEDITEQKQAEDALEEERRRLQQALDEVRTLRGIVPICANCKKIRDDKGYWNQVEKYVSDHTEAKFSHGICPDCVKVLYPDLYKK